MKWWCATKSVVISVSIGVAITVLVAWGSVVLVDWDGSKYGTYTSIEHHTGLVEEEFEYPYALLVSHGSAVRRHGFFFFSGASDTSHIDLPRTKVQSVEAALHPHASERWGNLGSGQKGVKAEYRLSYAEEARGWPLLALWWNADWNPAGYPPENPAQQNCWKIHGGIVLDRTSDGRSNHLKALPYRPIWRGFLINTLFYALTFQLLLFTARHSRRWNRKRKGLCLACAYDLSGNTSPGCPECGSGRQDKPAAVS